MSVQEGKVEAALRFLAESEQEYARLTGLMAWLDDQKGIIRAQAFMQARTEERSVADSEAASKNDQAYRDTVDKLRDAITEHALLRAKRDRAEVTIDCWRTEQATKRASNV